MTLTLSSSVAPPDLLPVGPPVTIRGLVKRYRGRDALKGVDLVVPAGGVFMLAGENGAGKTTLLRILLNLERADSGTIKVGDLDARQQGPAVRARVGYVSDDVAGEPGWMRVGLWLAQRATYYSAWDDIYLAALCRRLDINLERRLGQLSKGQTRRVQLVAALAHRPDLLVLDEPIDGLDPVAKDVFLSLVSDHLADTGCTVLIASHQIHEIDGLTDHVGVLSAGRIVFQGTRESLHQSIKVYSAGGPEGWVGPADLTGVLQQRRLGRDIHWTVQGAETEIVARITRSGGQIRAVTPLTLHDAVVTLMRGKGQA